MKTESETISTDSRNEHGGVRAPSGAAAQINPQGLVFQRAVRLAARIVNAPIALVCQAGAGPIQVVAAQGVFDEAGPLKFVEQLCKDARNQPLFVASSALALAADAKESGIGAAACIPLAAPHGPSIAWLCILDRAPRAWHEEDRQALRDLSASVAAEWELHQLQSAEAQALQQAPIGEQDLRASELRFAFVFQAHPLPMTIHDYPEGRYLDVNQAWLAQTGFSREEAIGKTSSELNTYVDRSVRARLFELLREHGCARGLEADMRMRNGEIRRFLLTSQQVLIDGKVRLLSGIQDITESKRIESELRASEQQLRLIAHALPIFIVHCDNEFRYKFVNSAYAARLGAAPEALLGRHMPEVLGTPDWNILHDNLKRVLAGELVQFETSIPYPAIGARFMRAVFVPEWDEEAKVRGLIGVLVDVSEQKQLEEERARLLQQSLDQGEQLRLADRRKDEFLAMLAHELRNPLAPLNNAAHLLPRLVREEAQSRQLVDIVQRQVRHMTRLVEDLLDVSRITLGKITLLQEEVGIAQIVRAGLELSQPLIDEKHHTCSITMPAEKLVVSGDPVRLAQVIGNLLNNAAKYTQAHGRITLSVERTGAQAVIRVADNGMGIAQELLPNVFDLFTQADHSLDRSQGGLGIGLALVKRLIELHGGSVEVFSAGPGSGTEFTVRLPLSA